MAVGTFRVSDASAHLGPRCLGVCPTAGVPCGHCCVLPFESDDRKPRPLAVLWKSDAGGRRERPRFELERQQGSRCAPSGGGRDLRKGLETGHRRRPRSSLFACPDLCAVDNRSRTVGCDARRLVGHAPRERCVGSPGSTYPSVWARTRVCHSPQRCVLPFESHRRESRPPPVPSESEAGGRRERPRFELNPPSARRSCALRFAVASGNCDHTLSRHIGAGGGFVHAKTDAMGPLGPLGWPRGSPSELCQNGLRQQFSLRRCT
jgi:hypothetical protein